MAKAFDAPGRSTASLRLMLMWRRGLVTEEEMSAFSPELQRLARFEP
jgi:hypothetical protein